MKNIIFTGGGSGGHVVPALTLIDKLRRSGKIEQLNYFYIGGRNSIERNLVSEIFISYKPIFTGKLRRYFSVENFLDIFKIGLGLVQSFFYLLKFSNKNTLVFATGGFVSVPVVIAAWLTGKTIYIHEQTSRVGLANKICSKFSKKVFVSFEDSLKFFPKDKTELSGYPVRDEIFNDKINEILINKIHINKVQKPILFITGGGNGSVLLNDLIQVNLNELKKDYFIIHQVGKNFIENFGKLEDENYLPVAFIGKEMIDLLKISKVIISRAGAGTVSELMALNKRSIFIPLKIAQKNEQYHNAINARKQCNSIIIIEDELEQTDLPAAIRSVQEVLISPKKTKFDGGQYLTKQVEDFLRR